MSKYKIGELVKAPEFGINEAIVIGITHNDESSKTSAEILKCIKDGDLHYKLMFKANEKTTIDWYHESWLITHVDSKEAWKLAQE